MKQFQFNYENKEKFTNYVRKIKQWCKASVTSEILFQVYSEQLDSTKVDAICRIIEMEMPNAIYIGCSTNGNIIMGEYAQSPISIVCTVFEYSSTKIEVFQHKLDKDTERDVTRKIVEAAKERPWVKAILLNITIRGMSMTDFCEDLVDLPEKIQVFGGGAFSEDMNENAAFAFSSGGEISDHTVVAAFIGGDDFHVESNYITGWKPLGRKLKITKTHGFVLNEIDGKPAYDVYYRYLNIKNDENFFTNTLEFPFFYEHNGINILRAPVQSLSDGSLVMTADIDENVVARLAYGDPWTILDSVKKYALKLQSFAPDAVMVFSCAARRAFWGAEEISGESEPFQALAPTSGFYTSGEFLRTGKNVNQHNVTLVTAAMREGDVDIDNLPKLDFMENEFSGKVSMINRLATFIQAATEELEETNKRLEVLAVTDRLTGLLNRGEIQDRITMEAEKFNDPETSDRPAALIMMDLDDFKTVNDRFGHGEGDIVLKGLADMLMKEVGEFDKNASVGRWGGEEFMVMLPGTDLDNATKLAEKLRKDFANICFPEAKYITFSLGVTEMLSGEGADRSCMRVDDALYRAKAAGKNCVVAL